MGKQITKTPEQAKIERQQGFKDSECPNCKNQCIGTFKTSTTGIIFRKTQTRYSYSCLNCGCEWEVYYNEKGDKKFDNRA